jgi:hypothetical protein
MSNQNNFHLYENTANILAFNFNILDVKQSKLDLIKLKLKKFTSSFIKN